MASPVAPPSGGFKGVTFLDLPEEIQKEIISHCSQSDWICLSLVSRHFRELAAAHIYRNFHIVFPHEDDSSFDSPVDGLADGLDTFVTSDYNYAKHLREISLDTLSTGAKAERAYDSYLFSVSCGKFMNTLLLLTLRKAKSLDTFKWNIRVELSHPVYKALHNIKSLKHFHVRLQAGPSLYGPVDFPAAPSASTATAVPGLVLPSSTLNLTTLNFPVAPPPPPAVTPPFMPPSRPSEKIGKESAPAAEVTTLAGFHKLESLAILDIDDLEVVPEITACVRNSSSTLRTLELSFSDALATQARKPSPEADPEDSDQDDEFPIVPAIPPPGGHYNDATLPARIFRAQNERKDQEAVLGRIFEIDPLPAGKPKATREGPRKKEEEPLAPGQVFIDAVKKASMDMWANMEGSKEFDVLSQQEAIDHIVAAAKLYVESKEAEAPSQDSKSAEGVGTVPDSTVPVSSPSHGQEQSNGSPQAENSLGSKTKSIADFLTAKGFTKMDTSTQLKPEDIDVAAPEGELDADWQDDSDTEPHSDDLGDTESSEKAKHVRFVAEALDEHTLRISQLRQKVLRLSEEANEAIKLMQTADYEHESKTVDAKEHLASTPNGATEDESKLLREAFGDSATSVEPAQDNKEELHRQITDYTRGTRGIALDCLAIYLIPTKATVLSKAVDLRTLKRLTLLNVGSQSPIWALMAKENKLEPLPLRKISTDGVCPFFLQSVSQLPLVDELYMLERGPRYKPESFAQKTKVTMSQIRKTILKKHMGTLKALMIKNEDSSSWDVDERAMQLICKHGNALEELAVAVGIRAMHTFLQRLPGLANLFAFHIISFRSDDTCLSVLREMRRFITDTLSHYPALKLEWISMGDDGHAQRILRHSELAAKKKKAKGKKGKGKGKWKAPPVDANGQLNESGYPTFPPSGWEAPSDSESDEDDEAAGSLELSDNIPFFDTWGVKIFQKEVVAGRL